MLFTKLTIITLVNNTWLVLTQSRTPMFQSTTIFQHWTNIDSTLQSHVGHSHLHRRTHSHRCTYSYKCTHPHKYTHSHSHAVIFARIHTSTHSHFNVHTHSHTLTLACPHTCMHSPSLALASTYILAYLHSYAVTLECTLTRIHTHGHTNVLARTYTRMRA